MNPRVTLFLLLVLVSLGLVAYGLNNSSASSNLAGAPTPQPTVLALNPTRVKQLTVDAGGKSTSVQKSAEGKWQLEPNDQPADDTRIQGVVVRLSEMRATSQVPDASKLSDFGLDKPSITATLVNDDGSKSVLLVGSQTPVGTGYYVKTDASSTVYVVPSLTVDDLKRLVDNPPFPPPTPTPRPTIVASPAPEETPTPEASPTP